MQSHLPDEQPFARGTSEIVQGPAEADLLLVLREVIGPTYAGRIVRRTGTVGAARMTEAEIVAVAGVPWTIARKIVALRTLGTAFALSQRKSVGHAGDVVDALPAWLGAAEVEHILAVALDAKNAVKAVLMVAKGSAHAAVVTARDIFTPLVRLGASAFVLAHNHPSGDITPSPSDVALTNRVMAAGTHMGIPLLDHLVVGAGRVLSFHETGLLPDEHEERVLQAAFEAIDAAAEGGE